MDEHLRLADHSMTLDLYWARDNSHMADGLFAYDPDAKVMAEADIAGRARLPVVASDNYIDNLDFYQLQVDTLLPVHFPPMKQAQVIQFIREGVQAARERCAAEWRRAIFPHRLPGPLAGTERPLAGRRYDSAGLRAPLRGVRLELEGVARHVLVLQVRRIIDDRGQDQIRLPFILDPVEILEQGRIAL